MKFIFFLLFILGIGGGGYFLLSSYQQKILTLHRQLVISKNQLSKLQTQYKKLNSFKTNYSLKFLKVNERSGIVAKDSILYLAPNEISPNLQKLSLAMEVGILDKVLSDNIIWYYVALPIDSDINCRGWVTENSFSNFLLSSTDIIKA